MLLPKQLSEQHDHATVKAGWSGVSGEAETA